jgi:hypothetical protein
VKSHALSAFADFQHNLVFIESPAVSRLAALTSHLLNAPKRSENYHRFKKSLRKFSVLLKRNKKTTEFD